MKTYELIITGKPDDIMNKSMLDGSIIEVDVPEFVREYRYFDDELHYMRDKVSLLQSKLEGKAIIINGLYAQIESIELWETFRVKTKVI